MDDDVLVAEAVRCEFDRVVSDYALPGAAVAVYLGGREVCWRGWASLADPTALVDVASVSKAAAAISLLILVDENRVDLDAPVAHYWPEFAAAGKEAILRSSSDEWSWHSHQYRPFGGASRRGRGLQWQTTFVGTPRRREWASSGEWT